MQRRYERFFIMFKPALTAYSIENQEIKGYMKIEIRDGKGRITTYIQGLKPLKNNEMYRIYLISANSDNSLGIPVGWLETDSRGRGEHKYEFNPDNIENSGLSIEKFNVAAISIKGDNINEFTFPVVGYKEREILWKNNFKEFSLKEELSAKKTVDTLENSKKEQKKINNIKTPENSENIILNQEKPNSTNTANEKPNISKPESTNSNTDNHTEKTQAINNISEVKQENNDSNNKEDTKTETPHQIFNKMVHKFYAEMEELQKYKVLTENDKNFLSLDAKKPEITDNIKYMFEHNSKTNPFKNTYNNVDWIKIQPYELAALNICTDKYLRSQFIAYSWKKYKYLILGQYNNEPSKYLLGVKDIYNPANSDILFSLGFKTFIGCNEKDLTEGEEGYWILEMQ